MSLYAYERDGDVQALIGVLSRSENPNVRQRAAEILGRFGDHEDRDDIVRALARAADTDERAVAAAAVDATDQLGGDATERLIAKLSGGSVDDARSKRARAQLFVRALGTDLPELRMAAASALGDTGHASAVPYLVQRFEDDDARVRARAARACGTIGDDRAIQPLRGLVADPVTPVRVEAAEALGEIGTPPALAALLDLFDDEQETVRRIAVTQVGDLESQRPIPALVATLDDDSPGVRRAAAYSLVQVLSNLPGERDRASREAVRDRLPTTDDEGVVRSLVGVLRESTQTAQRRNAAWLLGHLLATGNEGLTRTVVEALVGALRDDDQATQRCAATSLAAIGGVPTQSALLSLVADGEAAGARSLALAVLTEIGGDQTRIALEEHLRETDDEQHQEQLYKAISNLDSRLG